MLSQDTMEVSMGDVISLHGKPLSSDVSSELIVALARFSENLLTQEDIKRQFGFSDEVWEALGSDEKFIAAVREESLRRMRDGSSKREKSQQLVLKGPAILDSIASDVSVSPKHRVDAIKTLDTFAANGPGAAAAPDRFSIVINIGGEVHRFDKSIAIDANDIDRGSNESVVSAAKKDSDSG
jgi:hypothetical protein